MHFNILGKSIIVLSSNAATADLLDKRSTIYSSRPDFPVHELYVPDPLQSLFLREF